MVDFGNAIIQFKFLKYWYLNLYPLNFLLSNCLSRAWYYCILNLVLSLFSVLKILHFQQYVCSYDVCKESLYCDWPNPFLLLSDSTSLFYIFTGGSSNGRFNMKTEILLWGWLFPSAKIFDAKFTVKIYFTFSQTFISIAKCFPFCFC